MARKDDERSQQEQMRQILYNNNHSFGNVGRPRSRGAQAGRPRQGAQQQVPRQAEARQTAPQPRQSPPRRGRSFEQSAYGGPSRTRTKTQSAQPRGRSNAATWLLLVLVLVLLAVAGYLVFLLFKGGLSDFSLKKGGNDLALPDTGALLMESPDAGDAYVAQTIFIGDSNFERLREYGLVEPGTVAAKVGIGAGAISSDPFIEVTGQDQPLTIAQTMAAVMPQRILVMLGTNDVPNSTPEEFAAMYKSALQDLRKSAPKARIVVASIPPVASWKDSEMLNASAVRNFNEALLNMCETEGYPYLDVYAPLADESGYLPENYTDDGYHLTQDALVQLLQVYRTHAYNP